MRLHFRAPISTSIAIGVGLVVLLGYFIDFNRFTNLRLIFLQWAVILAAVALLVGVINLFIVHWRKITKKQNGSIYSLLVIVSLLITLVIAGLYGPTNVWSLWIFNYIQIPVESSLMAILTVALVYSCAHLLRHRLNLFSIIFLFTVIVLLLTTSSIMGVEIPGLQGPEGIGAFISRIPAVAGARGILFGVALGTIATALRVLIGVDRPFGG